jgi:hypothetical protein
VDGAGASRRWPSIAWMKPGDQPPTTDQLALAKSLKVTVPAGITRGDLNDILTDRIARGMASGELPSPNSINAQLNEFATRCFRDSADSDYITARMAFRARLMQQFLWSGLQAIEKYLKCILLLNRIPYQPKGGGHDINRAFRLVTQTCFDLPVADTTKKLIESLNNYGQFSRYYELPYWITGEECLHLDCAVWELRRYCRVLPKKKSERDKQLKALARPRRRPNKTRLPGGRLEEVLTTTDGRHPARAALVYQNHYFGSRSRKTVKGSGLYAGNSPLSLYPEMLDEVCKYVYLPKSIQAEYRKLLELRRKEGTLRTLLP